MSISKNPIGLVSPLAIFAALLSTFIYAKNTFCITYPPKARIIEFTYGMKITGLPGDAQNLKIWIPAASENSYQDVTLNTEYPIIIPKIARDKLFHNKILYYSFKSPKDEIRLDLDYKVKRYERFSGLLRRNRIDREKKKNLAKYLASNRLMAVSKEIEDLAAQIVKGKTTTIEKARAIYDYCLETLSYDKSIPGWGNGDSLRACSVKAGNCTDFHSLFVSLARASNIPAKFVIGFFIPKRKEGEIDSYHCWAEFYEDDLGWVPVDISEAWKNREKADYYFGNLDEDRIEFTEGRDIILEPPASAGALNYFIYPYAEIEGRPVKNLRTYFRFKEIPDWLGV